MLLELTPDDLLATTRSVRKRLDLTRPVEREVLEECLRLAQQAPTASYAQNWHFVVVTDAERRAALGELWRSVAGPYLQRRTAQGTAQGADLEAGLGVGDGDGGVANRSPVLMTVADTQRHSVQCLVPGLLARDLPETALHVT